ncbi:hypothetical protein [Bartonella sp. DGB2]|uniref:hypothetical protein n=1 Tax=Bartonella sp. DGB2 TaxID=3388426 RepID=UPI00398FB28B
MLTIETFLSQLNRMAALLQLEFTDHWGELLYHELAPLFTDEEFANACKQILHNEQTYGKMPSPAIFVKYSRRKQPTEDVRHEIERARFISKVSEYISSNFISSYEKTVFNESLTPREYACLRQFGGISELWKQVNDERFSTHVAHVLRRVGDVFDTISKVEEAETYLLTTRTEHKQLGGFVKLGNVVKFSPSLQSKSEKDLKKKNAQA